MKTIFFLVCLLLLITASYGQDISGTADRFIATLTPELRARALYPFDDKERFNMNFVPMVRMGPSFRDFNENQKAAAFQLLKESLSQTGYSKATDIIGLETVLNAIEGRSTLSDGSLRRDPSNYHLCIFGTPSNDAVWGWRFEGHHISLNFVSENGRLVSSTPSFFGSNPAIVKVEPQRGKQVLSQEMNLGFELVNSFTEEQMRIARISEEAPAEIISGNSRKATLQTPEGIRFTLLNNEQQALLKKLLQVYVDNYELGFGKTLMSKINKGGIENLSFAWAGSLKPGEGHYYRIQGPMLLIEYDNTQNNANHVHTVVRDLTNDFAEDILREHYKNHH